MTMKETQLPKERKLIAEQMASIDREAEYLHAYYQALDEEEKWRCEQREKAKAVVPQLEKHLPLQLWQQMLELFDTGYGAHCILDALRSGCTEDEGNLPL
jgi:hypothetical protein